MQKGQEIKWEVRVRGEGTKLTQLIKGLTKMGGDGVCVVSWSGRRRNALTVCVREREICVVSVL